MLENAKALKLVRKRIREVDGFGRVFGRRTADFCSELYTSSECDIIRINREDITYDVKRWGELAPLSKATVLANMNALKLQTELEALEAGDGADLDSGEFDGAVAAAPSSVGANASALDGADDDRGAAMRGDALPRAPWRLSGLDQLPVVNMPRQEGGGLRHMGRLYQPVRLALLLGGDARFSWLARVIGALIAEVGSFLCLFLVAPLAVPNVPPHPALVR